MIGVRAVKENVKSAVTGEKDAKSGGGNATNIASEDRKREDAKIISVEPVAKETVNGVVTGEADAQSGESSVSDPRLNGNQKNIFGEVLV